VTVCIAASCEHGRMAVIATDGALSYEGKTADTGVAKSWGIGDWRFMYAGELGNAELITEHMQELLDDAKQLTQSRIRAAMRLAFHDNLLSGHRLVRSLNST